MCARFTLHSPAELVARRFGLLQAPQLEPRYNVAPSQLVAVIGTRAGGGRGLAMFRWGFVPNWAADAKGPRPVNAKVETLAEKPTFRDSFRERRCLIPADGFYEWRTTPDGKKPLFYRLKSGELMALAGVWDVWRGPTDKLFTCAIIITPCNSLIEPVHDRMPAILPPTEWERWLDPALTDSADLLPLLRPYPAEEMEAISVSTAVNSSRHEGADCLTAVA
jgi:putative SOS response-associated peptidase YedK